jgi:hypothetical protein
MKRKILPTNATVRKLRESHPRQWLDRSSPAYKQSRLDRFFESHPRQRLCETEHESPKRKVGVLSIRPIENGAAAPSNPQPAGWGICEIACAALVGWTEGSPTFPGWGFHTISAVGGIHAVFAQALTSVVLSPRFDYTRSQTPDAVYRSFPTGW